MALKDFDSKRSLKVPETATFRELQHVNFGAPRSLDRSVSTLDARSPVSGNEEQLGGRPRGHSQQEPAVGKTADVGGAVGALPVADGDLNDLAVQLGGAEQQIEIAERIQASEIAPPRLNPAVVAAPQHLDPAQRVLHRLAQQIAQ